MKKGLKKNKKGFTLVEIIVVLLIIGILLAILIPSIYGYVEKAKDAQIEAEARSGFVAAQTITAREAAAGQTPTVTADKIAEELGETIGATSTIQKAGCTFTSDNKNVVKCAFNTKGSEKYVVFDTANSAEPTTITTSAPGGITMTNITTTPPKEETE